MVNSQHNEEQPIRWMLHFFTIGVVGWALYEGHLVTITGDEDLFLKFLFNVALLQGIYGAALALGSVIYPMMMGLIRKKLDISKEDYVSGICCLYGIALFAAGFGLFEIRDYEFFINIPFSMVAINIAIFMLLARPAMAHIIYRMGLWWFLLSLFIFFVLVGLKRDD